MSPEGIRIVDVALLGVTLAAAVSLFFVQDLFLLWLALEWLALVCLLSFFAPNLSLATSYVSSFVPKIFWPESKHWLWGLAIAFNFMGVVETVQRNAT